VRGLEAVFLEAKKRNAAVERFHPQQAVNMPSRFGKILAAVICLSSMFAGSRADERKSIRTDKTVYLFGNYRIDLVKENQSLQLVATGDGAFFRVQCFAAAKDISIQIPILEDEELQSIRGTLIEVVIWNENGTPLTLTMDAWKNVLAITIAKDVPTGDLFDTEARRFLEKLFVSRSFFALTAGGSTRTYPAANLPAARDAFRQACEEIRADYGGFVRSHPIRQKG
jgi:hypothetical protein